MSHARSQHPNAPLTPEGRRRMVDCVLVRGWTVEATAERFQVDAKTVRKWRDRFLTEGEDGLLDRSSRPLSSPNRTSRQLRRRVVRLRCKRRWGADRIGFEVGLAASTVQSILRQSGLGRLDRGDRATASKPVNRYQWDEPGDLIHVDIKKLAAIPPEGGWRTRGKGYEGEKSRSRAVGYRYIHTAVDDRSRLAYSEILTDEKAATAVGVLQRAVAWFADRGVVVERVLSDNGSCYRSFAWRDACAALGITHKRTRPYRPQTNGKSERFHRTLADGWAYARFYGSEIERRAALPHWLHFYNQHRTHSAIGGTPFSRLNNLPGHHN